MGKMVRRLLVVLVLAAASTVSYFAAPSGAFVCHDDLPFQQYCCNGGSAPISKIPIYC